MASLRLLGFLPGAAIHRIFRRAASAAAELRCAVATPDWASRCRCPAAAPPRRAWHAAALCWGLAIVPLAVPVQAANRYVNPAHAAAVDAGQGTALQPYRTITFAMTQLQPGDRLEIAAGTYREAILFPVWPDSLGTLNTVIEGKGQVLIKGSEVVSGWTRRSEGYFVKPWPKESAQVFVDGVPLQQIGGTILGGVPTTRQWPGRIAGNQDTMPLGSFYYEALASGGGNLHVRVDLPTLAGHLVEVSTRAHSVIGKNLANVTLRNLEFMHGNTSGTDRNGLVLMQGKRLWLDRIKVTRTDTIGIELDGDDNKLTHSISNDNGQLGLKARGNRVQLLNNDTSRNNLRRFIKWNEAGGAKFVGAQGLRNSLMRGHRAVGNLADGVWFDWSNHTNRIEGGVFAFNTGFGIHYEASHGAMIVDNVAVGNGQRGIYLLHSSNSLIAFNLVAGNKLQGIVIVDEGARDPTGQIDFKPLGNKVFGNIVAWNNGALVLPLDLQTNRSNWNQFVGSGATTSYALGWSKVMHTLPNWVAESGQDRNSTYVVSNTDAGASGAATQDATAYINWAKNLRTSAQPLAIDPDWLKLLPNPQHDRRPGPAF